MTNQQLTAHIDTLRAKAQDARIAWGEASLLISLDSMLSGEMTVEKVNAEKAMNAYNKIMDRIAHAEQWLADRELLSGRVEKVEPSTGRQVIGDLIKQKLQGA